MRDAAGIRDICTVPPFRWRNWSRKFKKYTYVANNDRFIGHILFYTEFRSKEQRIERSVFFMKGYFVPDGYMGYVNGSYMLFADENDYREYMED